MISNDLFIKILTNIKENFDKSKIEKIISILDKNNSIVVDDINNIFKKRKRCECHWSEFVISKILKNPYITDEINVILNNHIEYIENSEEYNKELKENFEEAELWFKQCLIHTQTFYKILGIKQSDVIDIYLTGKKINNNSVNELVKYIDDKQKKADVYININKEKWIGISVKKDKDCTLCNWSIEKLIQEKDPLLAKNLKDKKIKILNENGINRKWRENLTANREKYNRLMYGDNSYKILLNDYILNNKEHIKEIIANAAGSSINHFNIYLYDGNDYKNLLDIYNQIKNSHNVNIIEDTLHTKEYLQNLKLKTYYSNKAAKLWYYIQLNEVVMYRFEIRWKGDPFSSPQIQLFKL